MVSEPCVLEPRVHCFASYKCPFTIPEALSGATGSLSSRALTTALQEQWLSCAGSLRSLSGEPTLALQEQWLSCAGGMRSLSGEPTLALQEQWLS